MNEYKKYTKITLFLIPLGAYDAFLFELYLCSLFLTLGFISSILFHFEISFQKLTLEQIRRIDIFLSSLIVSTYIYNWISYYSHDHLHILDDNNLYTISISSLISGIFMYIISHIEKLEFLHSFMHILFILASLLFHRFHEIHLLQSI